jgi:hypothetical protein
MSSPNAEDTAEHLRQQRPVIQSKLIIRRVLQIDDIDDTGEKEYPRRHPFPIQVSTEHKCSHFSEPLVIEENEDNENATTGKGGDTSAVGESSPRPMESHSHHQRRSMTTTPQLQQTEEEEDEEEQESSSHAIQQRADDEDNDHDVENQRNTTNGQEQEQELRETYSSVETSTEDSPAEVGNVIVLTAGNATNDFAAETDNPSHVVVPITELEDDNDNDDDDTGNERTTEYPPLNLNTATIEDDGSTTDYFGIHDTRDRGTACNICLLDYQVGDAVAWSPNLDCIHTFHKDCVLDWLVRKPTCPNCRHDYLKGKEDDNV